MSVSARLNLCTYLGIWAALGLAGCSDGPHGPVSVEGLYRLNTVDGAELPAIVFRGNFTKWVTNAELRLGAADSAFLVVDDTTNSPLEPQPSPPDSLSGRYRVVGNEIFIDFAPPEAGTAYTDSGSIANGSISIEIDTHYPIGFGSGVPSHRFNYFRR